MKDLGTKRDKTMFDHPTSGPEVTYPKVGLPLSFVKGKDVKKDDEIEIKMKVKLIGWEDTEWCQEVRFECREGEIVGHDKKEAEEPSLLG